MKDLCKEMVAADLYRVAMELENKKERRASAEEMAHKPNEFITWFEKHL